MTDLQVKYQMAKETERANRIREEIAAREATVKEREAGIKMLETEMRQAKLPHEIRQLITQSDINVEQMKKITQEVINLQEDISLIRARTDLTQEQKAIAVEQAKMARRQEWMQSSGFKYVDDLLGSLISAFGKGSMKALIG